MRVEVADKPLAEVDSDLLAVLVFDGDDLPEPLAGAPGSEDVKGAYKKTTPDPSREARAAPWSSAWATGTTSSPSAPGSPRRSPPGRPARWTPPHWRSPDRRRDDPNALATAAVEGAILASYRFDRFKSKKDGDDEDGEVGQAPRGADA